MRVTFEAFHRNAASAIEMATQRLAEYQRQVASGKRVQRGSDDPSAAAAAIAERGHLARTDVYTASGDSAQSRLMVADTVLSDLVQQLSAAQVAVAGARGTTATAAQRDARARELEGVRDAVLRDLNTSFEGTHLFGGTASTTTPYVKGNNGVVSGYQGAAQEMSVDIDMNMDVTVAFNGEAVAKGSDADDVFVELDRAIVAARGGDAAGLDTAAAALQRAMDRVTLTQGRVGTSLRFIDEAKVRLGEASRAATARISSLEDANMAAAISGMSQADTVYRAALGAAGQLDKPSLMDYLR
jgi:flagellar hook-associated protein 3 FlgL